jgi:GNAT superfamily N-acetyltransferase
MSPHHATDPYDWSALLGLIRAAFAPMEGRIDPPSTVHALTAAGLAEQARLAEVWVIGHPPLACVILTPRAGALYVGKLAVVASERGKGHARRLIDTAAIRACALGLPMLVLQSRIELTENHAIFRALGFLQTGATAHPGYDRPTSLTFTKAL